MRPARISAYARLATFSAGAIGTTPATHGSATSNSLLITQPLTYQVTVNNGTGFNQV
jgi:hypothetical protein